MTKKLYTPRPNCHCCRANENMEVSKPKKLPEVIGLRATNKPSKLCPQQRFVKRPKHSGMITFDDSLRELPIQKSRFKKRASEDHGCHSFSLGTGSLNLPKKVETISKHQSCVATDPAPLKQLLRPREEQLYTATIRNDAEHGAMLDDLSHALSDYSIEVLHDRMKHLFSNPHNISDEGDSDDIACSTPEYSISMGALLYETMFIYRLLARADPDPSKATSTINSELLYDVSTWQTLCTLRRGLVLETHDLSHVAQTSDAPKGLRCLATRFSTSPALFDSQMRDLLRWVHQMSQNHLDALLESFAKINTSLISFRHELTATGIDCARWQKVEDNLHTYEKALLGDAPIEDSGLDCDQDALFDQYKEFQASSASAPITDSMDQCSYQYLSSTALPRSNLEQIHDATEFALKEPVLLILSGWLCLGPHIAQTFDEFCKVFKFLAWRGTTL